MAADAQAAKDLQALELRRAGVSIPKIREQLRFRTVDSCRKAIERAMAAQGLVTDPLEVRRAELDRLDRLQAAVWAKAARGDVNAIDRVLKLGEARVRIAGIVEAGVTPLTESYDLTVDELRVTHADAAVVAVGRRLCEQIDAASGLGDPTAVVKALYLVPHVMNVLRELGATPAARAAFAMEVPAAPAADSENVTGMAAWRKERGIGE